MLIRITRREVLTLTSVLALCRQLARAPSGHTCADRPALPCAGCDSKTIDVIREFEDFVNFLNWREQGEELRRPVLAMPVDRESPAAVR